MISVSVLKQHYCCIYLSSLCSCRGGYMAEGANRRAFPVQIRLMLLCHTGPPADVTQSLVKGVWDESVTPHSRQALINTQRTRHLSPQWGQRRPALNCTSTYIVHAGRILDQFCPSLLPSTRKIIVSFIGKHDTDKDRKTGCRDVEITGSARPSNEPASCAQIDSFVCFFAPVVALATSVQPPGFMPCSGYSVEGSHQEEHQEFDMSSLVGRFLWLWLVVNKLKFHHRANNRPFPFRGRRAGKKPRTLFSATLNKMRIYSHCVVFKTSRNKLTVWVFVQIKIWGCHFGLDCKIAAISEFMQL